MMEKNNLTAADIVKAAEAIKEEYELNRHVWGGNTCFLCVITDGKCTACPNQSFKRTATGVGCHYRKCSGGTSKNLTAFDIERVVSFYTKLIKLYKRQKSIKIRKVDGSLTILGKKILKIDEETYEEFENKSF